MKKVIIFLSESGQWQKHLVPACHKIANKRLKLSNCLHRVFLHNRRNHCPVFHDVASIAQLAIENWEQLLDFEYSYTVHFEEV